jgi:protein-disulfide isomerase
VSNAADDRGVTGTPTVYVNDKQLDAGQLTADGLQKAVDAVAS